MSDYYTFVTEEIHCPVCAEALKKFMQSDETDGITWHVCSVDIPSHRMNPCVIAGRIKLFPGTCSLAQFNTSVKPLIQESLCHELTMCLMEDGPSHEIAKVKFVPENAVRN